ncbi:MAG: NADPH-dependent glyceraldehyde-3-phosphate dehydrogenase / NAD-dependent glyceraldehyde-3-phosphate dehydrogenase, partial [uncultured Rubellimicrobium sp.]
GGQGGDQRLRPHRAQRAARHHRVGPHRYRGGGDQRSRPRGDQRASAALRFGPWPLSRDGDHHRRHDRRGPRPDEGDGGARPRQAALGPRRHRDGVHGHLHRRAQGGAAPSERLQTGPRLCPRVGRMAHGPRDEDHRLRREPRPADRRRSCRVERVLHDELPGSGGLYPQRGGGDRPWLHDHDPQLHGRPADARHDAQGPLPRPRGGPVDDPDLHRRGQGGGQGAARPQRQARRRVDPGADAERVGGGLQVRRQAGHQRAGDQRRDPCGGERPVAGHPRLYRREAGVVRLQPRPAFVGVPHGPDQGHGRQLRANPVLVRQRVGLLQPHVGYGRGDGQAHL